MHSWIKSNAKRLPLLLILSIAIAVLAACGGTNGNDSTSPNTPPAADNGAVTNGTDTADSGASESGDTAAAAGRTVYPLTLQDATNTEVTIAKAPQRVISLIPSETEILFAIGAGDLVAGVDNYSNYPPEAADKPKVGDMNTNIEAVAALNPDLVLAGMNMNSGAIDSLRALGITVFAAEPRSLDETIAHIELVGKMMDKQAEASAVSDKMRADRQLVIDTVQGAETKRVYLEFSPGWSVGKGEFLDELVTLAGGVNVAGDQEGWFEVDPETIIQANPEVIIFPEFAPGDTTILDGINSRPGWGEIEAVKNGRLHAVTNDPLVRVGPRLTEGLLEIAKAIHPDLYE